MPRHRICKGCLHSLVLGFACAPAVSSKLVLARAQGGARCARAEETGTWPVQERQLTLFGSRLEAKSF